MEVMIPNEMRFRLDGAILFYRRWSEYGYSYSAHNVAAVLHKVNENGSLAPGRALDMKALEYFFRHSNGADKLKFQDSKILARSYDGIVWYEKSRLAPIYFQIDREKEPGRALLNKLSGRQVMWPPLIFMIANGTLRCRAMRSNRRPTTKTKLYIAPLTHINETDGAVCLPEGLRLDRRNSLEENTSMVSELFYQGKFGHATHSMQQIEHPGGHDGFWIKYLKKKKHDRFPVELLKSANQTLGDLLK